MAREYIQDDGQVEGRLQILHRKTVVEYRETRQARVVSLLGDSILLVHLDGAPEALGDQIESRCRVN